MLCWEPLGGVLCSVNGSTNSTVAEPMPSMLLNKTKLEVLISYEITHPRNKSKCRNCIKLCRLGDKCELKMYWYFSLKFQFSKIQTAPIQKCTGKSNSTFF